MRQTTREVNLTQGATWTLDIENKDNEEICIGLNWGAIKHKTFFGLFSKSEDVDLDASFSIYDQSKKHLDTVYYGNLTSFDGAVRHSGDDRKGDSSAGSLADNEVIELDLKKISPEVQSIYIYLNSYSGKDFSEIPYVRIKVYQGLTPSIRKSLVTYTVPAHANHRFKTCMMMMEISRQSGGWTFKAIGQSHASKKIKDILDVIEDEYL